MSNTVIALVARMGSSRLKDKHLLNVNNKPILSYLIERIKYEFENEIEYGEVIIIIATPEEAINKTFSKYFDVDIFMGSKKNIPLRLLQAAQKYNSSNIVSVDGDDIFCSPKAMRAVYNQLSSSEYNHVTTEGLPLGMNVSGFSKSYLEKKVHGLENKNLETGWGKIFKEKDILKIPYPAISSLDLRLTLDYSEDFLAYKNLIESIKDFTKCDDQEIVKVFIEKEFYKINFQKNTEYWENFNKEKNNGDFEV